MWLTCRGLARDSLLSPRDLQGNSDDRFWESPQKLHGGLLCTFTIACFGGCVWFTGSQAADATETEIAKWCKKWMSSSLDAHAHDCTSICFKSVSTTRHQKKQCTAQMLQALHKSSPRGFPKPPHAKQSSWQHSYATLEGY